MNTDTARPTSRELVISAARRLFAEKGYAAVSIRDIAAEAGVSPALVIKHVGSKAAMFSEAISFEPSPLLVDAPFETVGEELVRRIVAAQRAGRPAPLTRAVVLVLPSPDPEELRARFDAAYLEPLTDRVAQHLGDAGQAFPGDRGEARRRAQLALAAATGLSVSLRVFHYHPDSADDEAIIARYGRAVQQILEG